MRWLVLVHRYIGIAMCLLFAMWFASGIVMVFVPYPELSPRERFAGLQPLDVSRCCVAVASAFSSTGLAEPPRQVRMTMVGGRPAFHFHPEDGAVISVFADTGEPIGAVNDKLAVEIANKFAPNNRPSHGAFEDYDQWTVPNQWNAYRPFHRIKMNDAAGTELYVSGNSGEVVRDTSRQERGWNWVGSVAHWIYPTQLRKYPMRWDRVVWWLSLVGIVGAVTGIVLGVWRLRFKISTASQKRSPYRGWMYWHHLLGLGCMVFVLTWIVSGWLSMDHGLLFSDPSPTAMQQRHLAGGDLQLQGATRAIATVGSGAKEIELLQLGGNLAYLLRYDAKRSVVTNASANFSSADPPVNAAAIGAAARGLLGDYPLSAVEVLDAYDHYYYHLQGGLPLPVVRLRFADPQRTWFYVDPLSARLLDKVDRSRRAYRWLYSGLHRLDFPFLAGNPTLRKIAIVVLCGFGFVFSVTGVVIGWRRLLRDLSFRRSPRRPALQ